MVDRPADILQIDPAKPIRFDWFTRADRALRRMPGLGVVIIWFIGEWLYKSGDFWGLTLLSLGAAYVLVREFSVTTGSLPMSSGGPSAPRRPPHPTSAV